MENFSITMDIYGGKKNISLESTVALIKKLQDTTEYSDITLKFENGNIIKAHKLILSMTSKKLEDMCGTSEPEILVKEDFENFKWIINHAYTSAMDFNMPILNLLDLYDLLKRYGMDAVGEVLGKSLVSRITKNNIHYFYGEKLTAIKEIEDNLKGIIRNYGVSILQSASVDRKIPSLLVEEILKTDGFNCNGSELELLKGLKNWASLNTATNTIEKDTKLIRKEMEPFLPHIRFFNITPEDIVSKVLPMGIFSTKELNQMVCSKYPRKPENHGMRFYCRPWNTYNILINKTFTCGKDRSLEDHLMLMTIQPSETINLYSIMINNLCIKGTKFLYIENDRSENIGCSTTMPFEFLPIMRLDKLRTYYVKMSGKGSIAEHKYDMYRVTCKGVDIIGEAMGCSINIKISL